MQEGSCIRSWNARENPFGFEALGRGGEGAGGKEKSRCRRDGTGGAWISVPASGNGFSKYSGKTDVTGRNRRLFAVLAHRRLLGTSMSTNYCLQNGILRKSHFPARSSKNPCTACSVQSLAALSVLSAPFLLCLRVSKLAFVGALHL